VKAKKITQIVGTHADGRIFERLTFHEPVFIQPGEDHRFRYVRDHETLLTKELYLIRNGHEERIAFTCTESG
jgi:hypothetical protein